MASWFSNFNNRFKLTIPADSVDSSLTNFPVMINLSSGAGKNNFDATAVFDDLGDDHQKRFAITKNDGTTQCPVEIEYWDATEEKAVLWTKIPTVYSSVDTDVYFYWDVTTSGNTVYVGDVGDTVAQGVWDDNFKLVMHMAQDPSGGSGAIKDSTNNANHGTPAGAMASADLVDGKIGKAIDFDGMNDLIDTTASVVQDGIATIEMSVKLTQQPSVKGTHMHPTNNFYIHTANNYIYNYGGADYFPIAITTSWQYLSITYNGNTSTSKLCYNGMFYNQTQQTGAHDIDAWNGRISDLSMGANTAMYGIVDEVRQSSVVRSDAWQKATYYSNWDNFIVFQQEDITTSWLSDWSKRIKLTIDKDKIDSTLVDFPVGITLISGSGVYEDLHYAPPDNVDDNFTGNNGDSYNPELWVGTGVISNNMIKPDTSLTSVYRLNNDFDIEVYWDKTTGSWGTGDCLRFYVWSPSNYFMIYREYNSQRITGTNGSTYNYSTYDWDTGYFRILKVDTNIKLYFKHYSGDSWIQRSSFTCITDEYKLLLIKVGTCTPSFDNFKLNSGFVFWLSGNHQYRKKIAITVGDGVTQLPVEIEQWEYYYYGQANLWTKVPSVSSNEDTILYLYYDSSKSDNTTYVGDTGEAVAQNVWDSNFKLVMHMAQDPNGDVANAIKDSTSNVINATPVGSMTSADLIDGKIGKAISFDETNDYLKTVSANDVLNITTTLTLEAIIEPNYTLDSGLSVSKGICSRAHIPNINQDSYALLINDSGKLHFGSYGGNIQGTKVSWATNIPFYVAGTYNSSDLTGDLFVDNTKEVLTTNNYDTMAGTTNSFVIATNDIANLFPGKIDEVRVSNVIRSAAWIKTTYYSNWDELISFGSEQEMPTHYYYGYITEDESPVSRTVRLYYRDTGVLMSDTTSNADTGYYYLTTSISGEHFIVTIDDDAGKDYNALILDRLLPRGIE